MTCSLYNLYHFIGDSMILRNEQILNVFSALNTLGNEKFSAKFAWKITTARGVLTTFVETLEKSINELRLKYAMRDEKGDIVVSKNEAGEPVEGTMVLSPDTVPLYYNEMTELMNVEITVENVTLSIDDFPATFEVSPNMLTALEPILQT